MYLWDAHYSLPRGQRRHPRADARNRRIRTVRRKSAPCVRTVSAKAHIANKHTYVKDSTRLENIGKI
jgi:hypothetical protein